MENPLQNPRLAVFSDPAARRAFTMHDRIWQANTYVYPVVSRRSKGISIGINLNPDKVCNFDCIYCSVDRKIPGPTADVDTALLADELTAMLLLVTSSEIYRRDPFDKIPPALRRINDIAFSGDGEPTTYPQFPQLCQLVADLKSAAHLPDVKITLITNATMFHRPAVRAGLAILDQHNGEIWAKLDAGTDAYYQLIDRTSIPLRRVLDNILWAAQQRPLVIQSLFMKVHHVPPPADEISAYIARLQTILASSGQIKLIQLYTVARQTTEAYATPLSLNELELIAQPVRQALLNTPVEIYP